MRKIFWLLIGLPAAVLLIVFSVANRQTVQLRLDPFNPQDPGLALELPFFVFLFAALVSGVIIGGLTVWISQGRFRRAARRERARAEELSRKLPSEKPALPAADGRSHAA